MKFVKFCCMVFLKHAFDKAIYQVPLGSAAFRQLEFIFIIDRSSQSVYRQVTASNQTQTLSRSFKACLYKLENRCCNRELSRWNGNSTSSRKPKQCMSRKPFLTFAVTTQGKSTEVRDAQRIKVYLNTEPFRALKRRCGRKGAAKAEKT